MPSKKPLIGLVLVLGAAFLLGFQSNSFSSFLASTTKVVNNGQFVTQKINGYLANSTSTIITLTAGQDFPISITIKNTGNTTWTSAAGYVLGPQNPDNNTTWGVVTVPVYGTTSPSASSTFLFGGRAPTTPGTYNFQWRMERNNVGFGQFTPNITIQVNASSSPADTRDLQRRSDMSTISVALRGFYSRHGRYPIPLVLGTCETSVGIRSPLDGISCNSSTTASGWDTSGKLYQLVVEGNLAALPRDPLNTSDYSYFYRSCYDSATSTPSTGQSFVIGSLLEGGKSYFLSGGDRNRILSDLNDDGVVSAVDLAIGGQCAGSTTSRCITRADINSDGAVDTSDLNIISSNLRRACQ